MSNCALEKHLLLRERGDALLFYINSSSVIVGRNQSPPAEADFDYCRRLGIPVIRRISGGGTVYHDAGNINFAFITDKGELSVFDPEILRPIVEALARLGIVAQVGVRREISAGGRKISGTAAFVTGVRQLFHGTLLYDTDLDAMRKALQGDTSCRGRKVASVPSEVVNLAELLPQKGTPQDFLNGLLDFFSRYYDTSVVEIAQTEAETLRNDPELRPEVIVL